MSVKPTGPAIPRPGSAVLPIVGGGYESDSDDATYTEFVTRKDSETAFTAVGTYLWDFTPDPNLSASAVVRARVTLLDRTLSEALDPAGFVVNIARASDSLTLTNIGVWESYANVEIGVPTWVTFATNIARADKMEALTTGTYPGYGPARLMATWGGVPASSTAPVGSEARIRLHEFYIGPIAAPPLRRYPGGTATPRLYPRPVTRRPGTY